MREMWVDPRFFDKKSFGCFENEQHLDIPFMRVVVLTKVEWDKIKPPKLEDPRD